MIHPIYTLDTRYDEYVFDKTSLKGKKLGDVENAGELLVAFSEIRDDLDHNLIDAIETRITFLYDIINLD